MKSASSKIIIGLTGGVGSGKSTILQCLKTHYGALVLEADKICNQLIEPQGRCYNVILELLGPEIVRHDGTIDRSKMAGLIFEDAGKRQAVNAILHPATFQEVRRRMKASRKSLIVYESAIPYEARFSELCQYVLYVYASEKVRTERLKTSRGYSEEKIRAIMRSQLSPEAFYQLADGVVNNNESPEIACLSLKKVMHGWGIKEVE